jgi:L-ascorbate metabolism protein UlaG (beta-lactamase superfamily)
MTMVITYYGKQFYKVQYGDTILAFNPIGESSKYSKGTRFGATIALSTTNNADYNGVEMVTHGDTVPFVIDGPGDYEVGGIFIKGVQFEGELNGHKYINTIYSLKVDGIQICFMGYLSNTKMLAGVREQIQEVDILFMPVGGGDGEITSSDAYKLAISFEPKIIIPMDGDKSAMQVFLKEAGEDKVEPLEKITLKKKDLDGKEGEIIILENQA